VNNVAPAVDAGPDATITKGSTFSQSGSFTDPDSDTWTATVDYGDGSGIRTLRLKADKTFTLSRTYATSGDYIVNVTVTDKDGGAGSDTVAVKVNGANVNVAPVVNAGPDATITKGSTFSQSGSFTDPDSDTWIATVNYGDGSGIQSLSLNADKTFVLSHTYADSRDYIVNITVTDKDGGTGSDTVTVKVTEANGTPVLGEIVVPVDPVMVGTSVQVSSPLTYAGNGYPLTAVWTWDDGSSSSLSFPAATNKITSKHTYTTAGVYMISLQVNDKDGHSASKTAQSYIVVYDPSAGFVTGGGWINSPLGAYVTAPTMTGKATFGFVSKYVKGKTPPTGTTEFQFNIAKLNFQSTSYDWLVVAGAKAQFKGTGTINGAGTYGFMLSAIDDSKGDKFRIKIWEKASGNPVYDNQVGAAEDANPTTVIAGGSIVVHK